MTPEEEQSVLDKCKDVQQNFYENLGNREYDCFQGSEENYLKLKIGYTLFGAPIKTEKYNNINENYTSAQCYDKDQNKKIDDVLKVIKSYSKYNEDSEEVVVSFMFNCTFLTNAVKFHDNENEIKKESNFGCFPIFRVRKCSRSPLGKNCCVFIDENLRVYKNWKDYLENNKIPKAIMFVPKDGKYKGDINNKVLLEQVKSPACDPKEDIKSKVDITTTAVSLVSTGITISSLIPAISVAPIVLTGALIAGAGVGMYCVARSSMILYDRNSHKQSISLTNNEARNCYLNIAAGATSVVTTGATKAASAVVNGGAVIGETAATALLSVNAANMVVNGFNVANSLYLVISDIKQNKKPSAMDIMHLTTSFLFFGHAVVNFKSACTIYNESQSKSFSDMIRSHSNDLWKKAKDTFFNADVTSSENNSSIKMINDSDDYCQSMVIVGLPEQEVTHNGMINLLKDFICSIDLDSVLAFGMNIIENKDNVYAVFRIILSRFEFKIQNILLKLLKFVIKDVFKAASIHLNEIFPRTEKVVIVLNFIINFLKLQVAELEIEYQEKKAESLRRLEISEDEYDKTCETFKNAGERMIYFLKICAFRMITDNGVPEEKFFRELIRFFWDWLAVQALKYADQRRIQPQTVQRERITCPACNGFYYDK